MRKSRVKDGRCKNGGKRVGAGRHKLDTEDLVVGRIIYAKSSMWRRIEKEIAIRDLLEPIVKQKYKELDNE